MDYQNAIDWLYSTQDFGIKLGLENVETLLDEFSLRPQLAKTRIIHVAGTNGKGSICAFAERILRDAGFHTGLFTSPHLIQFPERIRINGMPAGEHAIAEGLSRLRELVEEWENHPTFFELTFVLALKIFCKSGCDRLILETGMGGRLDATNAIRPDICVISSISLDHQQWLGDTIREIAGEKAGILKEEIPVIVPDDLHPEARDVVGRRALSLRIPCIEAHPLPEQWEVSLPGPHQRKNAALAVEAACRVDDPDSARLTRDGIASSLAETEWPGRFQRVGERYILDGAHNAEAAQVLYRTWIQQYGSEVGAALVFGAAKGKDIDSVLSALLPIAREIYLVEISSSRAIPTADLESICDRLCETQEVTPIPAYIHCASPADALEKANASANPDQKILVAGSLFLVGECLSLLQKKQSSGFEVSLQ